MITGLPAAGNQGQPTTGSSAPGATSTSGTSGRAPDAGSATHQGYDPLATQETRPDVASGPTPTPRGPGGRKALKVWEAAREEERRGQR